VWQSLQIITDNKTKSDKNRYRVMTNLLQKWVIDFCFICLYSSFFHLWHVCISVLQKSLHIMTWL